MSVFEKRFCSICGEQIGILSDHHLGDGHLCRICASKLSPWYKEGNFTTVDEMRKHLIYRAENRQRVVDFELMDDFKCDSNFHVFVDKVNGKFAVGEVLNPIVNPDIIDLSQVIDCRLEKQAFQQEAFYRDQDGVMQSYEPQKIINVFDLVMKIRVRSPWFDEISFPLNGAPLEEQDDVIIAGIEDMSKHIAAVLTRNR